MSDLPSALAISDALQTVSGPLDVRLARLIRDAHLPVCLATPAESAAASQLCCTPACTMRAPLVAWIPCRDGGRFWLHGTVLAALEELSLD